MSWAPASVPLSPQTDLQKPLKHPRAKTEKPQHLHLFFSPPQEFKLSRRRRFPSLSPHIGPSFQGLPYNQPPVSLTLTNAYFSKKPKLAASGSPPSREAILRPAPSQNQEVPSAQTRRSIQTRKAHAAKAAPTDTERQPPCQVFSSRPG